MEPSAPRLPHVPSPTVDGRFRSHAQTQQPVLTPMPSKQHPLHKRQVELESSLTSVCGYISGNGC